MTQHSAPGWAKPFLISWGEVTFAGAVYPYAILNRSLEPDLVGFMGYIKHLAFLFISEDVP